MLLACMPMKNESWILRYTLSSLSEFVDGIIVLDDGSTDDSVVIAKSYSKVMKVIEKGVRDEKSRNEPEDWNRLTSEAIKMGATWILYTDADEMLEPKFAQEVKTMMKNEAAGFYRFRKISVWKNLLEFRTDQSRFDHQAKETLNPVLVRASKTLHWPNPKGNLAKRFVKFLIRGERFRPVFGRVFPKGVIGEVVDRDDLVSIHFNHLSYERIVKKQIFYAVNEKLERPRRPISEIVEWVYKGINEKDIKVAPVLSAWHWNEYLRLIDNK